MNLGKLFIAEGAFSNIPIKEVYTALVKFENLDFGDIDEKDRQANAESMLIKGRILGAYKTLEGDKFYIQLEAGHQTTTIMLAEEY